MAAAFLASCIETIALLNFLKSWILLKSSVLFFVWTFLNFLLISTLILSLIFDELTKETTGATNSGTMLSIIVFWAISIPTKSSKL